MIIIFVFVICGLCFVMVTSGLTKKYKPILHDSKSTHATEEVGPSQDHNSEDSEDFTRWRGDECWSVDRNYDPYHQGRHADFWKQSTSVFIKERHEWKSFIADEKRAIPYSSVSERFSGRGLVLLGGNRDTLDRILVTLRFMKLYESRLPVEIHYIKSEIDQDKIDMLTNDYKVTTRPLDDSGNIEKVHLVSDSDKNFHLKAAAIVNSAFEELLYLDSDNIPVRDPAFLFDTPNYRRTGAVFWSDTWKTHLDNPIWGIIEKPCQDEWEQESGQILINKSHPGVWRALMLTTYMQKKWATYFELLNGDKDTFRFAWKALDQEYWMTPTFPTAVGYITPGRFCGVAMLQSTPEGRQKMFRKGQKLGEVEWDSNLHGDPMFMHANLVKEYWLGEISDPLSAEALPKVDGPDIPKYAIEDIDLLPGRGYGRPRHGKGPDSGKGPFAVYKRYAKDVNNRWLRPEFWLAHIDATEIRPCMDVMIGNGEGDIIEHDIDEYLLPGFNRLYDRFGGLAGKRRT